MSIWDLLGIPDISGILDVLKPNDASPQYQFLRSLGTGLLYLGIVLFIIFLLIIAFTTPVLALIIGIVFTILLMIAGAGLLIYTHDDAKDFQEIQRKTEDAEASIKESEAEAAEREEELARQRVKTQSGHERVPLNERGRRPLEDGSKTSELEETENEK